MKRLDRVFFVLLLAMFGTGCQSDYLPKPKGYNRIVLPAVEYQNLPDTLPYQFEYSVHAKLLKDSSWIAERYWVDIFYPHFDANLQITYKSIPKDSTAESLLNDSFRLTAKHNVKAYAIDEKILVLKSGNVATVNELEGDVPSQFQFHITDSVNHFMRGALYFKTATQNDSLAPAIDYLKNDIVHLLNSLEWKDN
ncbi:MAG: gliding motility lipoprotein GldD [Cyclobacteriaceae bacterium]